MKSKKLWMGLVLVVALVLAGALLVPKYPPVRIRGTWEKDEAQTSALAYEMDMSQFLTGADAITFDKAGMATFEGEGIATVQCPYELNPTALSARVLRFTLEQDGQPYYEGVAFTIEGDTLRLGSSSAPLVFTKAK